MAVFLFVYGTEHYCVRVGFSGQRPLVYGLYAYNAQDQLPSVPAQTYRTISKEQYEWLRAHLLCDVSFVEGEFAGRVGNLECRTHGIHFRLFDDSPVIPSYDLWDDRLV